jgi:hypothetical protein
LLLPLLLLAGAGSVSAQQTVADVVILKGILKVRRDESERIYREIGLKIPLVETDVVHSGKDTRAKITVRETGETITLYADSHLRMSEIRSQRSLFQLAIGKALFLVRPAEKEAARRETLVRTATVTVGVKGTEFVVGSKEDESYVMTVAGTVSVRPGADPQREVQVKRGEAYFATPDQAPAQAVPVSAATRQRVLREDGLDALRKASGAPDLNPPPPAEPIGLGARIGLGYQRIEVPLSGTGASALAVESEGVQLSLEYSLFGPVTLDFTGFRGGVGSASGGSVDISPPSGGGAVSSLSAMLGVRAALGRSLSWAAHAGLIRETVTFKQEQGETLGLSLSGPAGRVQVDYRLTEVWFAGLSYALARVDASGSLVNQLGGQGIQADSGTMQVLSLTAGANF